MKLTTKEEIIACLIDDSAEMKEQLFSEARSVRHKVFDNKIYLYGFIYFSTWCRNNCNFCYYRRENDIDRYRKSEVEILEAAAQLAASGVNLIDLTMGEDESYHADNFNAVLPIIKKIKTELNMPVMISPGVVKPETIDALAEIGTDWYALYQETHNKELFKKLRYDQDYDVRMQRKLYAKKRGMLIEEGLLIGVGEDAEDIADSLLTMGKLGASQVRVMSFVPQQGSPMEHVFTPDRSKELKIIALLRILYPHALIPASLDIDGIEGLESRINAGANVVTSIIPPKSGLMGVAQGVMDVDEGGRTVYEAGEILKGMGLASASTEEYCSYLKQLKKI